MYVNTILLRTHKTDIGWPLLSVGPFLQIGITSARFHGIRNLPHSAVVCECCDRHCDGGTPPIVLGLMDLSGQRATNALVTDIVLFDL